MEKKKIFLAIIFLIVSIGLGFLLYKIFFAKDKINFRQPAKIKTDSTFTLPKAEEGTPEPTQSKDSLPTATTEDFGQKIIDNTDYLLPGEKFYTARTVSESPILNNQTSLDGTSRFYNKIDGKFYKITQNGDIESLSNKTFYNVQNITWSPIKNESIIEYPDGSNIYYNFETQKQVTLPKHWEDFSFSPQGDKIASKSIGLSPENRWLVSADPEGKNIKLIEPLGANADKVIVDWSPNRQVVALSKTGESQGLDREEILFVGLNKENFKSIVVEGRGFQSQWSPTGVKLLYSVHSARSNYKPELWVTNSSGNDIDTGRKLLNINTWANKCAFANDKILFCAVPKSMPIGAGFAPNLTENINDTLYKIDLETGIRTEIKTDADYTMENLTVSENGQTIYFQEKNSGLLFNLPL